MEKILDLSTKLIREALNILLLRHPIRTALGILTGMIINTTANLFEPALVAIQWLNIRSLNTTHYLLLGVFILHIPSIISIFRTRSEFSENVEEAFRIIRKAKENGLSEREIKEMYRKLCDSILEKNLSKSSEIKLDKNQNNGEKRKGRSQKENFG